MGISGSVKKTFILAGFLCLVHLLEVNCSDSDLEVKSNLNSANSGNSSTEHDGGSNAGIIKKRDEDHSDKSGEDILKTSQRSNSSIPLESKEGGDGDKKSEGALDQNLKPKEDKDKEVSGDVLASKSGSKEENIRESSNASSMQLEKGKSRAEECDPSYMCTDKKRDLVACLQVPGDESPNLSLLIRNGGKQPLKVEISAAQFVQLEETQVQLRPEEDKMVKVSIEGAGNNSLIYLKAGEGSCSIDFKDLISQDLNSETQYSYKLYYLNRLSRTNFYLVTLLGMVLILASGWMCVGFGRKYFFRKIDYQPVEMELPITDGSKMSAFKMDAASQGGDNGDDVWVDDWDGGWGDEDVDEEASLTPTLPVTPSSLSARGLASRRLSKEGWKD